MTLDKEIRATPKKEGSKQNYENRDEPPTRFQPSSGLDASREPRAGAAAVQARSEFRISIIQTAGPNPATVGQPLTFTVMVNNNSAPQHMGLKDFFPEGAELVSATPSQGNCGSGHRSNAVQCALGDLSSGGSATVEVVVLPTGPGTAKNSTVGGGEHSPEVSDEATVEVKPAP